jgi:hypothetical protein
MVLTEQQSISIVKRLEDMLYGSHKQPVIRSVMRSLTASLCNKRLTFVYYNDALKPGGKREAVGARVRILTRILYNELLQVRKDEKDTGFGKAPNA